MEQTFDVIIIGAGASGLFCAMTAAARGCKVAVLEHNAQALKKVSVSGGGKCNFTHLDASAKNYVSENPYFAISALQQFSPQNLLEFMSTRHLSYKEKTPGQLFCAASAQEIMNILIEENRKVSFFYNSKILKIERQQLFCVVTQNATFSAPSLVVATGGASYPVLGASEFGYQIAKQFGHKIIPYKPALVPFNLDSELMKKIVKLKGSSLPVKISCGKFSINEQLLFTHFGISGPAVLQASLYWNKSESLMIDLLPQQDAAKYLLECKKNNIKKKISLLLKPFFSEKIIDFLLDGKDMFIAEISNRNLQELGQRINHWEVVPVGTQGFKLAEVTKGGVDVNEVSSQTMESKKVKGLYFIGEVLDVTGQLGGFNLQWAWSSGWVCGQNV